MNKSAIKATWCERRKTFEEVTKRFHLSLVDKIAPYFLANHNLHSSDNSQNRTLLASGSFSRELAYFPRSNFPKKHKRLLIV